MTYSAQAYATQADQTVFGINPNAYASKLSDDRDAALLAASEEADGYLASQYTLPLISWGRDLRKFVCYLADEILWENTGFSPDGSESGENIETRSARARKWLTKIQNQEIHPPGIVDSTPAPRLPDDDLDVDTTPARGLGGTTT